MQDLGTLNEVELIDLLADYTLRFTKLFKEAREDSEYNFCKARIQAIMDEITLRKKPIVSSVSPTQ